MYSTRTDFFLLCSNFKLGTLTINLLFIDKVYYTPSNEHMEFYSFSLLYLSLCVCVCMYLLGFCIKYAYRIVYEYER